MNRPQFEDFLCCLRAVALWQLAFGKVEKSAFALNRIAKAIRPSKPKAAGWEGPWLLQGFFGPKSGPQMTMVRVRLYPLCWLAGARPQENFPALSQRTRQGRATPAVVRGVLARLRSRSASGQWSVISGRWCTRYSFSPAPVDV
jgi:hypothetical protein